MFSVMYSGKESFRRIKKLNISLYVLPFQLWRATSNKPIEEQLKKIMKIRNHHLQLSRLKSESIIDQSNFKSLSLS